MNERLADVPVFDDPDLGITAWSERDTARRIRSTEDMILCCLREHTRPARGCATHKPFERKRHGRGQKRAQLREREEGFLRERHFQGCRILALAQCHASARTPPPFRSCDACPHADVMIFGIRFASWRRQQTLDTCRAL